MSIVTPSLSQLISGRGLPLAAQSRVTFSPAMTTVDLGVAMKTGAMMLSPDSAPNKNISTYTTRKSWGKSGLIEIFKSTHLSLYYPQEKGLEQRNFYF